MLLIFWDICLLTVGLRGFLGKRGTAAPGKRLKRGADKKDILKRKKFIHLGDSWSFSRKVEAYKVSPQNSTYLITSTFRQAFESRNAPWSLMFYSDQGEQYTSKTFRKLLRMNKVVQSFSAPGQPHDNTVMASFFSFMKQDEIYHTQHKSEQQFEKTSIIT